MPSQKKSFKIVPIGAAKWKLVDLANSHNYQAVDLICLLKDVARLSRAGHAISYEVNDLGEERTICHTANK